MTDEKPPEPEGELEFGRTVLQFFVIPAFVVAICVGVFFFFAWLVSDEKTGVDYLNEVRAGSASRRWQAAFELSKIITMGSESDRLAGLVPEMVMAFEDAADDDPRVRHYLALSLGHLADPAASPTLMAALADDDPSTRLYSAWALGSIGEREAVEPLLELVGDPDDGVRKMAIYALGAIGDVSAVPRLQVALSDPVRDVSWNAAVSLAQLQDASGEAQLLQMLDHEFLARLEDMDEGQKLLSHRKRHQSRRAGGRGGAHPNAPRRLRAPPESQSPSGGTRGPGRHEKIRENSAAPRLLIFMGLPPPSRFPVLTLFGGGEYNVPIACWRSWIALARFVKDISTRRDS